MDDLDTALERALAPRRLNDDSLESIQAYHWDYWFFPEGGQPPAGRFPRCSAPLIRNAALVADLPISHHATTILTPDGHWHDLKDFGWTLLGEPSPSNDRALDAWTSHAGGSFANTPTTSRCS